MTKTEQIEETKQDLRYAKSNHLDRVIPYLERRLAKLTGQA